MTDDHTQGGRPVDPAAGAAGGSAASEDAYLGDIARPKSPPEQGGPGVMSALTMLAGEQGELRAELKEFRKQLGDVLQTVHQLGKSVTALSALESKVLALADSVDQLLAQGDADEVRPVDLAHIDSEKRNQVLADLVTWVRNVVFAGWPRTQEQLRSCWLYHPDLVNRMLWLRSAYAAAYDEPRARPHAAADWHRWLDDVMDYADQITADCPSPDEHSTPTAPRDDLAVLSAMQRRAVIAEIHTLMQVTPQAGYSAEQVQAAQQRARSLVDTHGITESEYNTYMQAQSRA